MSCSRVRDKNKLTFRKINFLLAITDTFLLMQNNFANKFFSFYFRKKWPAAVALLNSCLARLSIYSVLAKSMAIFFRSDYFFVSFSQLVVLLKTSQVMFSYAVKIGSLVNVMYSSRNCCLIDVKLMTFFQSFKLWQQMASFCCNRYHQQPYAATTATINNHVLQNLSDMNFIREMCH